MAWVSHYFGKRIAMKDLRDPKERQRFLQDRINQNLRIRRSKKGLDLFSRTTKANNSMMSSLADLFEMLENKDEIEYRKLLKQFRLGM